MNMRILIDPKTPKPRTVSRVADILRQGGIIVYPTDTVYGLGCCISNKHGIEKINQIKVSKKPRSIMMADIKDISMYAKVSNEAYRIMRILFPGSEIALRISAICPSWMITSSLRFLFIHRAIPSKSSSNPVLI